MKADLRPPATVPRSPCPEQAIPCLVQCVTPRGYVTAVEPENKPIRGYANPCLMHGWGRQMRNQAPVLPTIDSKVRGIHRYDFGIARKFAHSDQARVGQVNPAVGVLGHNVGHRRQLTLQVQADGQAPRRSSSNTMSVGRRK